AAAPRSSSSRPRCTAGDFPADTEARRTRSRRGAGPAGPPRRRGVWDGPCRSTPRRLQAIVEVVETLVDAIELRRELGDLALGLAVDGEIELAAQPILRVLAVLTHHDHRRLHGGQHR